MSSLCRLRPWPLAAGALVAALGLQGCVAAHVAGATIGVAGAAVKTTAKVAVVTVGTTGKVAGAAVHLTAKAAKPAPKPPPQ